MGPVPKARSALLASFSCGEFFFLIYYCKMQYLVQIALANMFYLINILIGNWRLITKFCTSIRNWTASIAIWQNSALASCCVVFWRPYKGRSSSISSSRACLSRNCLDYYVVCWCLLRLVRQNCWLQDRPRQNQLQHQLATWTDDCLSHDIHPRRGHTAFWTLPMRCANLGEWHTSFVVSFNSDT